VIGSAQACGVKATRRHAFAAALAVVITSTAFAGEHVDRIGPDGARIDAQFVSTQAEQRWYGVTVSLRDYRVEDDSIQISAWPQFGFTVCHSHPMRIDSPAGRDLAVPTGSDHLACIGRVPAAWVRDGFTVRVPMFNARPLVARLDVNDLDWQRLRVDTR
jgi:hypothetical protein